MWHQLGLSTVLLLKILRICLSKGGTGMYSISRAAFELGDLGLGGSESESLHQCVRPFPATVL